MTYTFEEAIELATEQKIAENNPFSAYEVTTLLREMVSDGEIFISDRDVENVCGNYMIRVEHPEVRQVVHTIMSTKGFSTDHSKGYIEYLSTVQSAVSSWAMPVTQPVTQNIPHLKTLNDSEFEKRVVGYVERSLSSGNTPTLKSTQSALKGFDVKCDRIASVLKANNFYVSADSPVANARISKCSPIVITYS